MKTPPIVSPQEWEAGRYLDITAFGRQEDGEDSPESYPQTKPYEWWTWHDE